MFEYDAQKGVQHVIERDGRVLNPGDISTQQGTDRNGRDMSASEVNAAKVVHTRDAIGLSPFAWGRWHGEKWPGDALSQTFKNASLNRNVTVGSRYYALFREDTEAVDLPWAGSAQYDFNLSQGQVHFVEKTPSWVIPTITPGQIDDGRLSIDFVNQRFNTHIEMSHPEAGSAVLDLGGSVNRAGKFAAHDATGMAAGAVSANGGHAGLLFERALDTGVFQGISNWERK